ncbi:integrase [Jeongeupia sp. HS-3]|uniref:tyrosine-type recombinase/integrase n=1 Tax=Jeongeupia sp. HS-3 TaxID=1009682 RepID=UPI0018A47B86|nr:integrase arm-type DNA-binding domain-containing protein [Jeongeupia sp. HS-3]BCL75625.1 integrase [Jeongeupia sp. HS-3]
MARKIKPLSDTDCRNAKSRDKDYSLFDGGGLFLLIKASGTKSWRFKFTKPNGKSGLTAFGDYPALSLAEARAKREEARGLLAVGVDPIENKRQAKLDAEYDRTSSFEAISREWHAKNAAKWSAAHARNILARLEAYVFPAIGRQPVTNLKTRDLLAPLRKIEENGTLEVAGRVRQHISGVMRYAVQTGLIDSNPAGDLSGALEAPILVHRASLPLERVPELMQRLDAYRGRILTALALRFTLLTFVRSSELRFMCWNEIDADRATWTIPASRELIEGVAHSHRGAKMKEQHIVPLSRQALTVLEAIRPLTGRFDLVFAGDHDAAKPMSENTVNAALRRMGYDTKTEVCGHGFRAMACTALTEAGLWDRDVVERQMSHKERNSVRVAYTHKVEFLEQRRLMMQWWADWLDANHGQFIPPHEFAGKVGNVVSLRAGKAA